MESWTMSTAVLGGGLLPRASWFSGSIRNKILSVFVLAISMVATGAIYGFTSARGGLATVARVNDTLIAQAIEAQALEAIFKEQVQQWMGVLVRGRDASAKEKSWKQFIFREREVRRGGEKLREAVELPEARALLDQFLAAHSAMGAKYREALAQFEAAGLDAARGDAAAAGIEAAPAEMIEELVRVLRAESSTALGGAREQATQGLGRSLGVILAATLAALFAFAACAVLLCARPCA
jgi:hypothetical protein